MVAARELLLHRRHRIAVKRSVSEVVVDDKHARLSHGIHLDRRSGSLRNSRSSVATGGCSTAEPIPQPNRTVERSRTEMHVPLRRAELLMAGKFLHNADKSYFATTY